MADTDTYDYTTDKQFLAASPEEQHDYLKSADKDYAKASTADQQEYLQSINGGKRRDTTAETLALVSPAKKPDIPRSTSERLGEGQEIEAAGRQKMGGDYVAAGPEEVLGGLKESAKGTAHGLQGWAHEVPEGLHRAVKGAGVTAAPLAVNALPIAAATAPAATVGGFIGAGASGALGKYGSKALGANEEWSDVAGDASAAVGGTLGAKAGGALGKLASGVKYEHPTSLSLGPFGKLKYEDQKTPLEAAMAALRPKSEAAFAGEELGGFEGEPGNFNRAQSELKQHDIESLVDLRKAIPEAKEDVWQPYADAIEKFGDEKVKVGTETSTIADLEKERLDNTAQLAVLKSKFPTAQRQAMRVDPELKALVERQGVVTKALDQALQDHAGISGTEIRRTHGALQAIEKLAEKAKTSDRIDSLLEKAFSKEAVVTPQRTGLPTLAKQSEFPGVGADQERSIRGPLFGVEGTPPEPQEMSKRDLMKLNMRLEEQQDILRDVNATAAEKAAAKVKLNSNLLSLNKLRGGLQKFSEYEAPTR